MNTEKRLQEVRATEVEVRGDASRNPNENALRLSILGPCRVPAPVPVPVRVPVHVPLPRRGGAASLLMAVAAVACLGAAAPAHAVPSTFNADGRLVDVGVRVEGHRAPLFFKPGDHSRVYFEAFQGENYSVVLRNNTGRRIGVLVAVDGLNVVTGEKSRLHPGESMYVLNPWGTTEISGWRTSLSQIRKFVFVDEDRSYAMRTGQANGDLGWIRVLAFEEQRPWNDITPQLRHDGREESGERERRGTAPQAAPEEAPRSAAPRDADRSSQKAYGGQESVPGTGWGDKGWDPVRRVDFIAERRATDHIVLRYEYASGLRALGIFPPRRGRVWERDSGHLGFAKPPKW